MLPDEVHELAEECGWTDDTVLSLTMDYLTAHRKVTFSGLVRHLRAIRNEEAAHSDK